MQTLLKCSSFPSCTNFDQALACLKQIKLLEYKFCKIKYYIICNIYP